MSSTFTTSGLFNDQSIEELNRLRNRTSFNLARRQFTLFAELLPGGVSGYWFPFESYHLGNYGSGAFYFEYQGLLFKFEPVFDTWNTPEVHLVLNRASNPEFSLSREFTFNDLGNGQGSDFSVIPNIEDNREVVAQFPGVQIQWDNPDQTFINMLLYRIKTWKIQYASELRDNLEELVDYRKKPGWTAVK